MKNEPLDWDGVEEYNEEEEMVVVQDLPVYQLMERAKSRADGNDE